MPTQVRVSLPPTPHTPSKTQLPQSTVVPDDKVKSFGPLRGTPAETLSVQLGEFIYLWQVHILSQPLILYSCQKTVQYAPPRYPYMDVEEERNKTVRPDCVCTRVCVHGVCVLLKTYGTATVHMWTETVQRYYVSHESGNKDIHEKKPLTLKRQKCWSWVTQPEVRK